MMRRHWMWRGGRSLIAGLPLMLASGVVRADEDWAMFNRMLALAQSVLGAALAGQPGDSRAADALLEGALQGRNAEANALAREMFADMPPESRERLAAVARTALALSRREARIAATGAGERAAIEARKDLAAMGLAYHDSAQFLAAVRRDDRIAVQLFVAGRGLDAQALARARELAPGDGMRSLLAPR